MFRKHFIRLMIAIGLVLAHTTSDAQEFPIAAGSDSAVCFGGAFDGTNYLVSIMGDSLSQNSIAAQRVSPAGSLVGARISVGRSGIFPGPSVAFDGSNYLLIWMEGNGDVEGQFVSSSGGLVGTPFAIATSASYERAAYSIAFGDSDYLVVFAAGVEHKEYLYGQRVSKSGTLIGSKIQISGNYARENAIAFDGTNYLVTWVRQLDPRGENDIYGQFVGKTGTLTGGNFLIVGGPYYRDNPISLAFDGARYLVAFHEQEFSVQMWNLFARFITTAGAIEETIAISGGAQDPALPVVAFGGDRYLITWMQQSNFSVMGRIYNPSGIPIASPFVIFGSLDNKVPIGWSIYGDNAFLAVATRVDTMWVFTDGDVYGSIIEPVTGIEDEGRQLPEKFALFQNYPNPFNPITTISFTLPERATVSLKVYDLLGREVAALVRDETMLQGSYSKQWDASGISSGIYFYRIQAGSLSDTRKIVLLR
ncbi:MAG: T9SS type A sorting domain-containing protein [Candidatus Krumholzibacteria bacterium]|nr:T9SS type A sorting domain-containing protein [Candidatus Krumholzibacteria bacterium]